MDKETKIFGMKVKTDKNLKDEKFRFRFEEETLSEKDELLELAWGLIANANEGNWDDIKQDWRIAAEKWRDRYHETR